MNFIRDALEWLTDPAHWVGNNGIALRIAEHVGISLLSVAIAALLMIPLGVLIGHTRRGTVVAGLATGMLRSVPTLGVITLVGIFVGVGLNAPVIALVILAAPSLLTASYAGVLAVDHATVNAMRAMGVSEGRLITTVELPLAFPTIVGGLRSAILQVSATATLAAYIANYGLGRYIFAGLKSQNYELMLVGALLVIAITLIFDGLMALIHKQATALIQRAAPNGDEQ